MKATFNGAVIAESNATIVIERPAASEIAGHYAFWRGVTVAE